MRLGRRLFLRLACAFYRWAIRRYEASGMSTIRLLVARAIAEHELARLRGHVVSRQRWAHEIGLGLAAGLRYGIFTLHDVDMILHRVFGLSYTQLSFLREHLAEQQPIVRGTDGVGDVWKN